MANLKDQSVERDLSPRLFEYPSAPMESTSRDQASIPPCRLRMPASPRSASHSATAIERTP